MAVSGEKFTAARLEGNSIYTLLSLLYSVSCLCITYSYFFYKKGGRVIFIEMEKYKRYIVRYKEQVAE